jgi:hypothetical protein
MSSRSLFLLLAMSTLALGPPVAGADVRVTNDDGGAYVSSTGGGTDATLQACGSGRRTQNEPSVAIDPSSPNVVVAGANDYCAEIVSGVGNLWTGYYRSTNGGTTWTNSLVPGYPGDTSAAGEASPAHGSCAAAGDPTQSFDGEGRLYYGFICFNRAQPTNGSIYVARFDDHGATYVRTVRVARGTPSVWGLFQDKINVVADPASGNVYVAWARYPGQSSNNDVYFSRSTDGGRTFSRPFRVAQGLSEEQFADLAVGPDGTIYLTYRTIAHQTSTEDAVWLARSTDEGVSFGAPVRVAGITPFDSEEFSGNGASDCGDGPFACPSGLTYARFSSLSAVAADGAGVHVVWNAKLPTGQSKVFVRNSPDGVSWPTGPVLVDTAPTGHQIFPDIAAGGGVLSVVFQDSRTDPAYSPSLPPGDTATGANSGDVLDAIVARSTDGGQTWTETTASTAGSNPNWEVRGFMRSPFFGDYNYVSRVGGLSAATWTDTRDLVPGTDPRETGADDDADGFDGAQTCTWVPNDIDAAAYESPTMADPCMSVGGLDQNIYFAGGG